MLASRETPLHGWRTAFPVSPQAAEPAVPETGIGTGGVPGCSGMPGAWKSQPARQSSRIPRAGDRRRPWRLRCRHGEDRLMGAGKPGLERPRHDRRFPPPGVTPVPSYGWTTYKRGVAHVGGSPGGAGFRPPQRFCLRGRALAAVVGALPGKPCWKRFGTDSPRRLRQPWRGGARRVPASPATPRLEGEEVEGATPGFWALVRHRGGGGGARQNPPPLLPFSGSLPPQ